MKGISRYNHEGYPDPTAHEALSKVYREQLKAERQRCEAEKNHDPNDDKEEKRNERRR